MTISEGVTTVEAGAFEGWTAEQHIAVSFATAEETPEGWADGWAADATVDYTVSEEAAGEETPANE